MSSRALAAALLVAGAAGAQVTAGELILPGNPENTWSATAGRTVGQGATVLSAEAGWPAVSLQALRGVSDDTDVGLRASLLYGFEGTAANALGLAIAAPLRHTFYEQGRMAITGRVDPGVTTYAARPGQSSALWGLALPSGLVVAYRLDPRITLDVGADLGALVSFANPAGAVLAPAAGAGGEYAVDRNLAITVRARFGSALSFTSGADTSAFAFWTVLGIAFNAR
jgi:hypothetical protein